MIHSTYICYNFRKIYHETTKGGSIGVRAAAGRFLVLIDMVTNTLKREETDAHSYSILDAYTGILPTYVLRRQ